LGLQARVHAPCRSCAAFGGSRAGQTPRAPDADARRRLDVATAHLDKAIALWRRAHEERAQGTPWRRTRKMSRRHIRRSRRQWKLAVRMLQTA